MIISHKYKFIFIKTAKTAGTSIEVFLSQQCGEEDIVTPIHPHVEPHVARNYQGLWNPLRGLTQMRAKHIQHNLIDLCRRKKFFNHIHAQLVRARIPSSIWDRYFKFCVERNPWDKTLSHYYHLKYRSGGSLSLSDYFRQCQGGVFPRSRFRNRFAVNFYHYTDHRGTLIVDRVLKYERLAEELAAVFAQLGIPYSGTLGVKAKSECRTDRRPYWEVLSAEHRAIIDRVFEKEIAMHGYSFDPLSTLRERREDGNVAMPGTGAAAVRHSEPVRSYPVKPRLAS